MMEAVLFRIAMAAGMGSPMALASQVITFTYDPSGRPVAIVYAGTGAPNGCTVSTPTWGTGTLGCFRWNP